jgi:peptidoglycan hydrolase CwlO-like protein
MSVSGIMCNGTIHELLIPPTIARKNDFDSKIDELEKNKKVQQTKIDELEQRNKLQQTKIDELEKHMQQHSAMFELLRQRIETLETIKKID